MRDPSPAGQWRSPWPEAAGAPAAGHERQHHGTLLKLQHDLEDAERRGQRIEQQLRQQRTAAREVERQVEEVGLRAGGVRHQVEVIGNDIGRLSATLKTREQHVLEFDGSLPVSEGDPRHLWQALRHLEGRIDQECEGWRAADQEILCSLGQHLQRLRSESSRHLADLEDRLREESRRNKQSHCSLQLRGAEQERQVEAVGDRLDALEQFMPNNASRQRSPQRDRVSLYGGPEPSTQLFAGRLEMLEAQRAAVATDPADGGGAWQPQRPHQLGCAAPFDFPAAAAAPFDAHWVAAGPAVQIPMIPPRSPTLQPMVLTEPAVAHARFPFSVQQARAKEGDGAPAAPLPCGPEGRAPGLQLNATLWNSTFSTPTQVSRSVQGSTR